MKQSHQYKKAGKFIRILQFSGALKRKNLFWSWYEPRNFGDWIGPYIFEHITGYEPIYCPSNFAPPASMFFSAGSILRHVRHNNTATVWGSGIISKEDEFARPKEICAVRGPHSRDRCLELGYQCGDIFGDPAILLPRFYRTKQVASNGRKIGIIPHYVDKIHAGEIFEHAEEYKVIDVCQSVEKVIDDIASCRVTLSSSLHGLIVSHAYGIKSAWIEFTDGLEGDGVKFLDYYGSGGIEDVVGPHKLANEMRVDEAIDLATGAPMPDLTELHQPLLDACPFVRDRR